MAKIVANIEYTLEVNDPKAARIIAELIEKHGTGLGSENWSIWEFPSLTEITIKTEILDK